MSDDFKGKVSQKLSEVLVYSGPRRINCKVNFLAKIKKIHAVY